MSIVRNATSAIVESVDVMAMIFEEVIRECEAYAGAHQESGWYRLIRTLRTLSQISPPWRLIVVSTPRLWTNVRYFPNRHDLDDRIGFLSAQEYLRRSGVRPLDLWIADNPRGYRTPTFENVIADAISTVTRHRTTPVVLRATHIALAYRSWPAFDLSASVVYHCRQVKHLTLTYADVDHETIPIFAKLLSLHANLISLQLVGFFVTVDQTYPSSLVELPCLEYIGIESSLEGASHILRMIRSDNLCTVSLKANSRLSTALLPLFDPISSIDYLLISGIISLESLAHVLLVAPNASKLRIHHVESKGIYTEGGRSPFLDSIRDGTLVPHVRLVELESRCHFTFAFIFPAFAERFLGPYMTVADAFALKTDNTLFSYGWGLFRLDLSRFLAELDEAGKRKWADSSKHVAWGW